MLFRSYTYVIHEADFEILTEKECMKHEIEENMKKIEFLQNVNSRLKAKLKNLDEIKETDIYPGAKFYNDSDNEMHSVTIMKHWKTEVPVRSRDGKSCTLYVKAGLYGDPYFMYSDGPMTAKQIAEDLNKGGYKQSNA